MAAMSLAAHPVHASVAFLRIPEFDGLPVAEQAARKERLERRVRDAIAPFAPGDRLVLEAEDGLAVVLFGALPRALDAAAALQGHDAEPLQAGLGYGPLALTPGGSEARVFGDGLAGAASAARFAAPGRMLVTEGFATAMRAAAPDRAGELAPAGEFTDTNVRVHRFFAPDSRRRAVRRRKLAVFAAGGSILILLAGVLGRDIYQPLFQTRPAIVILDVKPRGEVYVDGNSVGRIPPLTQVELAPGRHRLAIRSAGARPYEVNLELRPAQRITLTHTFPPPQQQKPDLWRDLKKRFGS
jgi:PEGA domain